MRAPRTHDYRREALGTERQIRRFEAQGPGRYAVDGVGPDVAVGDRLRFTLKGARTLELVLTVRALRPRLIPSNGWAAELEGDAFEDLQIHAWRVVCEGCGEQAELEFTAPPGAPQAALTSAATARLAHLGWDAAAHRCPRCAARTEHASHPA